MTDLQHELDVILDRHGTAASALVRGLGVDGDDLRSVVAGALRDLVSDVDLRGVGSEHARVLVLGAAARAAAALVRTPAAEDDTRDTADVRELFGGLGWRMQAAVWATEVEGLPLALVAADLELAPHLVEGAVVLLSSARPGWRGGEGVRPTLLALAGDLAPTSVDPGVTAPIRDHVSGPRSIFYGAAAAGAAAVVVALLGGATSDDPVVPAPGLVEAGEVPLSIMPSPLEPQPLGLTLASLASPPPAAAPPALPGPPQPPPPEPLPPAGRQVVAMQAPPPEPTPASPAPPAPPTEPPPPAATPEPPAIEPPAVEPPTIEPPTIEPPVAPDPVPILTDTVETAAATADTVLDEVVAPPPTDGSTLLDPLPEPAP